MRKCIVIGAGLTGAVVAENLASNGYSVTVIEKRNHIAGNCYDYYNNNGILIHKYGPHIFNTESDEVWEYMSRFCEWQNYNSDVFVEIDGEKINFPFNLNSIEKINFDKIQMIEKKLVEKYGYGNQVPILEFMKSDDNDIVSIADFLYKKDFLPYALKQWGIKPEELDKSVTARVPIRIDRDNSLFKNKYKGLPKYGFAKLFENILSNSNIELKLNFDALSCLRMDLSKNIMTWEGKEVTFPIVYTGPIDELFDYKYGELPYRSLDFIEETGTFPITDSFVITYPDLKYKYTRSSEYRHIMRKPPPNNKSSIIYEIPKQYVKSNGDIPFYPYITKSSQIIYDKYKELSNIKNFYLVGRLAEFKYMNMDFAVDRAIAISKRILERTV